MLWPASTGFVFGEREADFGRAFYLGPTRTTQAEEPPGNVHVADEPSLLGTIGFSGP